MGLMSKNGERTQDGKTRALCLIRSISSSMSDLIELKTSVERERTRDINAVCFASFEHEKGLRIKDMN